jgi:hypothetical protein
LNVATLRCVCTDLIRNKHRSNSGEQNTNVSIELAVFLVDITPSKLTERGTRCLFIIYAYFRLLPRHYRCHRFDIQWHRDMKSSLWGNRIMEWINARTVCGNGSVDGVCQPPRMNSQCSYIRYKDLSYVSASIWGVVRCPVKVLEWPRRFQEVKVPRFLDNGTGWW